jgi:hypothetical protein|tara:strand:- start:990 stop:1187 length:198 start_codon:yes stop_codon:yes gene_type:complete
MKLLKTKFNITLLMFARFLTKGMPKKLIDLKIEECKVILSLNYVLNMYIKSIYVLIRILQHRPLF